HRADRSPRPLPLQPTDRFLHIDGLRGCAAFIVLIWHIAVLFFPAVAFGLLTRVSHPAELWWHGTVLSFFMSGTFAVTCFFVISGYVLTIGYFRSGNLERITDMALARFPRLFLPAAFSTLLMFGLRWIGPSWHLDTLKATGTFSLMDANAYASLKPTASALASNLFWLPWFQLPDMNRMFSAVLWTMGIELWCSLIVIWLAIAWRGRRGAPIAILAVAAVFVPLSPPYGIYIATFLIGTAIAAYDPPQASTRLGKGAALLLFALGVWLGGYTGQGWTAPLAPYVAMVPMKTFGSILKCLGALLVFVAVIRSPLLTRIFSWRAFVFLGRISFSLYLTHMFALGLFGSGLFLLLGDGLALPLRSAIAAGFSIVIAVVIAIAGTRLIDEPSVRLSKLVPKVLFRKTGAPPRQSA
ncbi:MAG: acyltransferase family protein, partial [Bosea sp. (in: a-proteobacteria)]